MKRTNSRSTKLVLISITLVMLSSLACNLPDLQAMVIDLIMENTLGEAAQDFSPSDLLEELGAENTSDLLEMLDPEQAAGMRVFTGTSDYDRIFQKLECSGHQTKQNMLTITVTEAGAVNGTLQYLFNSGDCPYTQDGETYIQQVEFLITGIFEGTLTGDQGTIALMEDVKCTMVYDSSSEYPPDPDCNIFPPREVDVTITNQQMTGLIRFPANEDPTGMFNVNFSATQE